MYPLDTAQNALVNHSVTHNGNYFDLSRGPCSNNDDILRLLRAGHLLSLEVECKEIL